MQSKLKNILKKSWKELLIIVSITIILLSTFLFIFNLHHNKKGVINNIPKKNKKLFATEYNREFIADNERIIIVKNEDILNHKVIFDLDDPRISKIEIFVLSKEILNDLNIKLYAYHNNKEYIIDNKNFLDSNYLTYKMLNTNKERIEVGYKNDPSISSLKAENLIFIKISYTLAE